ncbi:MAG: hypothetical protein ABUT39_23465 [Acidobacteriota bacterium]
MAEPMHARTAARHPANRRPRIPHPHLAPQPQRPAREPLPQEEAAVPAAPLPVAVEVKEAAGPQEPPRSPEDTGAWTAVDLPVGRPASRSRRGSARPTPAERTLRSALHVGLLVNLAVLLASRLLPARAFGGWSYGGDDFLLAAAVLLSGYALLAVGRMSRRDDPES